jgi:AcrR family transcriptional regulator
MPGHSTRETIIQTAVGLFKERGFDNVTIAEICKKSRVNKTTFYYYFESKHALLKNYYLMRNEIGPSILSVLVSEENPVEQLWLMLMCGMNFILDSGWQIIKQIYVLNLTKDIQSFRLTQQKIEVFSAMKTVLVKAQTANMVRNQSDPKTLLVMLIHMTYGVTYSWCGKQGGFDLKKTIRVFFENILDVSEECRKEEPGQSRQMWSYLFGGFTPESIASGISNENQNGEEQP